MVIIRKKDFWNRMVQRELVLSLSVFVMNVKRVDKKTPKKQQPIV